VLIYLIVLAVIFKFVAAILFLRLVRFAGRESEWPSLGWLPWVLIFATLLAFAALDGILLNNLMVAGLDQPSDIRIVILTLMASVLALISALILGSSYPSLLRSRRSLQKREVFYHSILDHLPYPVVLKDCQFGYLMTSPAFNRFVGSENEDLIGLTDYDFFPPAQAEKFRHDEEEVMKSGVSKVEEEEVVGSEGSRWLRITRTPIYEEDGTCTGILVSARDVTDRKNIELPLEQRIQHLAGLHEASLALVQYHDTKSLLENTLKWASKLLETSHGIIGLVDREKQALVLQAGLGNLDWVVDARVKLGEDLAGKVWQSEQALMVEDYQQWSERSPFLRGQDFASAMGVPLMSGTQVIGVLALFRTQDSRSFSAEELDLLKSLARLAQTALKNTRMHQSNQQLLKERQQAIDSLQYRVRLEHLAAAMATFFINAPLDEMDRGVKKALQTIGSYLGVDCAYLLLFPREQTETDRIYEWCQEGVEMPSSGLQDFHAQGFAWWMGKLNRLETVNIPAIKDLPTEALEMAEYLKGRGIRSFTAVPLVSGRYVVGYFGMYSLKSDGQVPQSVLGLLKILSEMFVNTLERRWAALELSLSQERESQRMKLLEQRNREVTLITEMGDLLQASRTADEAYPIIARYARRLIPIASGAMYLTSGNGDPAEEVVSWGDAPPGPSEHELGLNECWALRRGRIYSMNDPETDPLCGHITGPAPKTYICAPLIAQGETIGLLHLRCQSPDDEHACDLERRQSLANMLAEHIALALSNLHLRDELRSQAIRDPLTGLFNRRYMEATLEREIRRAMRHGTSVGVIMFDVDRLKPVNDTLGHDAGDELLRGIGNIMLTRFRGEDVACRYGGDEFTIVLPEASLSDVWQRAEELRESVKRLELDEDGREFGSITVSIGVAVYPDHGATAERLVQISDAAAYEAKAEGGDRVMIGRALDE
jgi:diguanylate cyclase (GGDEF)-like protein/PAS domain S-box-containing protein